MRCNECVAVIEEYFDGELESQLNEQVTAHMAACDDCAATFDALLCEQEIYANYRRDIEVTPALWQRVRVRVEEGKRESAPPPASMMTRLRERFAAFAAGLSLSPAMATSMALVAFAVVAGSVWLANSRRIAPPVEVAYRPVLQNRNDRLPAQVNGTENVAPLDPDANQKIDANDASLKSSVRTNEGLRVAQVVEVAAGRKSSSRPVFLPASNRAEAVERVIDTGHALIEEDPLLNERPPVSVGQLPAQLAAEAEDTEVARHIEKAQLLLRSFKNMSVAEGQPTADIAYEKRLSKELLNENILLRRDADNGGNVPAERLLSTLEPYLLDIANLHDQPSTDDVRSITERMKKNEIIAALQVY